MGASPCAGCIDRLHPLGEVVVGGSIDRCVALLDYDELSRRLIAKLKYGGVRTGVGWFVAGLAARIQALDEPVDLITWVPSLPAHRRRRGFDQAEVLARPLARVLGKPAHKCLVRAGRVPQTGRARVDRIAGPVVQLHPRAPLRAKTVLLIDDVMTTGSSLRAAAHTLGSGGAARVVAAVAAHRRAPSSDGW